MEKHEASVRSPIQGMETVVASVSGYHGSERFKLIKMISQTGASYVGTMNQFTTHLVCWEFEGKKYELAGKFKTVVVNHRWVEECIKKRRRVLEHPYTLKCGKEVGPIHQEFLLNADQESPLCAYSNKFRRSKVPVIDVESEDEDTAFWTASSLLTNNSFQCLTRSQNRACYKKRKVVENRVKPNFSSKADLTRLELDKQNRDVLSLISKKKCRTSPEPSHRGRRLVKKFINADTVESLEFEQEGHPMQFFCQPCHEASPSENVCDVRNRRRLKLGGRSENMFFDLAKSIHEDLDNTEEIDYLNNGPGFGDINVHAEEASSSLVRDSQNPYSLPAMSLNDMESNAQLQRSAELSCVICWTNFSLTRGILPCGHRFCFSCIQNWADYMTSNRKTSTCPLCKASFVSITKVDGAVPSDQKIYSQTIPNDSSNMDIYVLPEGGLQTFVEQVSQEPICSHCHCREPEDLLVRCHLCHTRSIHSYCLDPPLFPWTCVNCKDLQMIYHQV